MMVFDLAKILLALYICFMADFASADSFRIYGKSLIVGSESKQLIHEVSTNLGSNYECATAAFTLNAVLFENGFSEIGVKSSKTGNNVQIFSKDYEWLIAGETYGKEIFQAFCRKQVPDQRPGTMILFGAGLFVFSGHGRKIIKKSK